MRIEQAIELISGVEGINKPKQQWADLGCGDGMFTRAIAHLVGENSVIHAADINEKSLANLPEKENQISIIKHKLDFVRQDVPFDKLDGILMANSLHFVKDKHSFITRIRKHLNQPHILLIIEYDLDKSNPWVPYPINFKKLQSLFQNAGYKSIEKLTEIPSIYNRANIYSAIVRS